MKHNFPFCLFLCLCGIFPALASADEPTPVEWARNRVRSGLLTPLLAQEDSRSKFSRVLMPAHERRLRILAATLSKDHQGRGFMPYAIDVRYGDDWQADIVGCVYKRGGQIYVQRGDQHRPAEFLLGKDVGPVDGVCQVATPPSSSST